MIQLEVKPQVRLWLVRKNPGYLLDNGVRYIALTGDWGQTTRFYPVKHHPNAEENRKNLRRDFNAFTGRS